MTGKPYQDLFLEKPSSGSTVIMTDPISLPAAARLRLQLIHIEGKTSQLRVDVMTTTDSLTWTTLVAPSILWGTSHAAPGLEVNESTNVVNATACRLRVEHPSTSCDTMIRLGLRVQKVR